MSDLVKRLRIKAGMIEMGEMIAWGSDSALMREAADALEMAAPDVQGEVVYLYRRLGLHDFVTCNHDRYTELSGKPNFFETKILYAAPQPAEQQPTISDEIPARTTFGGPQRFTTAEQQAAPDVAGLVEALEQGFPLLSDEGLDEVEHHCEWVIQRERKRVHSILAAYRKGGGK